MPPSTAGRLLVSSPSLTDPNFDQTIVLMIEHNGDGALGLVLNRPTDLLLRDCVAEWADAGAEPAVVFGGGPVAPRGAICLARTSWSEEMEGWHPVVGDVGVIELSRPPGDMAPGIAGIRLFAGYSGWGPGQLEGELAAGAWYVVTADPADALTARPEALWRDVLRRQRGRLALLATYSAKRSLN